MGSHDNSLIMLGHKTKKLFKRGFIFKKELVLNVNNTRARVYVHMYMFFLCLEEQVEA